MKRWRRSDDQNDSHRSAIPTTLRTTMGPRDRPGASIALTLRVVARSEGEQRVPGGDRHVLDAIDEVGDRRGGDLAAEVALPEFLAGAGVESKKVSFAVAGKKHIAGGGEDA